MKKEGETEGVFGGDKELNLALKKDEMGILKNLHPVVNKFLLQNNSRLTTGQGKIL